MAIRYAVASGNWSNTAIWNGGTLPTSADDVYANTFTVNIDQDVTVLSLRNHSTTGVTNGGSYTCSTSQTINAATSGFICTGTAGATLLTLTNPAGTTVNLIGNISGGTVNTFIVTLNAAGTVNLTGNIYAIPSPSSGGGLTINGGGSCNVTGNVFAGTGNSYGIGSSSGASITVTGTVTGGYGNGGIGIVTYGAQVVNVTGNLYGGSGTGSNQAIVSNGSSAVITVVGNLYAQAWPALSGVGTFILTGPFYSGPTGVFPIAAAGAIKLTGITNNEMRFVKSSGGTISLYSPDVVSGTPAAANVRAGTVYGGGSLTGTCNIPAAASVSYGVPVDNTTGTAVLQPKDVAAVVGAQIAAVMSTV